MLLVCKKNKQFLPGYSTGAIIKEHAERQKFIEDFYANHSKPRGTTEKTNIFELNSKHAVSLPDVLEEDRDTENMHSKGGTRKKSLGDQTKSNEDLLHF